MSRLHGASAPADARILGFDLVRAVAVLMVLVAHGSFLLEPALARPPAMNLLGVWGVELFFVLSGFLVGGILIDTVRPDPRWLANFWLRRWMRTVPNYYLFLGFNVVLWRLASGVTPDVGLYLVFAQNLVWPHPPFFVEAWSLAVEEIFYLLAPLAALAALPLARDRARTLLLLVAALVGLAALRMAWVLVANPAWDEGIRKVTALRLDGIVYGVLASYLCRRFTIGARAARWAAGAGVGLFAISLGMLVSGVEAASPVARSLIFCLLPAGFAAWLPAAATVSGRSWNGPATVAVRSVALWSYSLYLTHLQVVRLVYVGGIKATSLAGCLMEFGGYLVVATLWAALTYRFVERPIMAARDRVARWLGLTAGRATAHGRDGVRVRGAWGDSAP